MDIAQFNEKWAQYLEPRFYGMNIDNSAVCAYLDQVFEELSKVPNFQYSQIKMKNGSARFYCKPWFIDTEQIERKINQIVNESSSNRESNL